MLCSVTAYALEFKVFSVQIFAIQKRTFSFTKFSHFFLFKYIYDKIFRKIRTVCSFYAKLLTERQTDKRRVKHNRLGRSIITTSGFVLLHANFGPAEGIGYTTIV